MFARILVWLGFGFRVAARDLDLRLLRLEGEAGSDSRMAQE